VELDRDPVRVVLVWSTFIGVVLALLVGAEVIEEVVAGVAIGVLVLANALAQELVVRPATVPREPLEDLVVNMHTEGTTFQPPPEPPPEP
jgi:hypothetical protein